jgi:transcriptional regulator with XRE-family HTH domain
MLKQDIKDTALKKEIGNRFKEFRQAIKKTRHEFVDELSFSISTIFSIETGKTFPGSNIQNYLYHQYQLNIS